MSIEADCAFSHFVMITDLDRDVCKIGEKWMDARQRWKKERREDWSDLGEEALASKLIERKVISVDNDDAEISGKPSMRCSVGMRDLCQTCCQTCTEETRNQKFSE